MDEITKSCEKLINQTQVDLELFKNEQNQLKGQLFQVLEENKQLSSKLESVKSDATSAEPNEDARDDATREKIASEALANVKKQIDYLEMENHELRSLNQSSRKTIANLENEVQNYREHIFEPNAVGEVKHKYETAIKLLESTIKTQKTEIAKQAQMISNLFDQKNQFYEHIKNLEMALKEKACNAHNSSIVEGLERKLAEVTRLNKDLDKSLKMSKKVIEERFEREKCALQKVQEALSIAEAAVADKEDAQKREQVVKEECDNLAVTIGHVMDEAARKVDKDMETLRKKFAEKEKGFIEAQEKLKEELQNVMKFNQILETRCGRFQEKYKEMQFENKNLSEQIEDAAKALEDMESRLKEHEKMFKDERHAKICLEQKVQEMEDHMQNHIHSNKLLKDKYKFTLDDVSKGFEKEISRLKTENVSLNQFLKSIVGNAPVHPPTQ